MSQLKPGMGCTLDGAASDNKAVQRGSGEEEKRIVLQERRRVVKRGRERKRERERSVTVCERERKPGRERSDTERPTERKRTRDRERTRRGWRRKRWTIERRPLGSELSTQGYGTWSIVSGFCVYPKLN